MGGGDKSLLYFEPKFEVNCLLSIFLWSVGYTDEIEETGRICC